MSEKNEEQTYVDQKGRLRWHCNDQLGDQLKQLHDYLVIGGYPESHAARYQRLAHTISRLPDSIRALNQEGRLTELPGVSGIVATIISEFLEYGSCRKMDQGDETFEPPPRSVLDLTAIPRLGAKTAKLLYQEHGVDSLETLEDALESGTLAQVKGIGKSMLTTVEKHLAERLTDS